MSKFKSVYDIIKRQNGEAFAKAIRQFDSGIFDIPNLPQIVRYAGRDVEPLLPYLESLKLQDKEEKITEQTPFELLEAAGYDAFYADSLEKQNSIQKYFAKGEELCTFRDKKRYQTYHIIHAVKKNVNDFKREDFQFKEEREDAYARSVISIQILKTGSFIKICNRYNHTVAHPDNTFNSNPDHIIEGLSHSLKQYFNVDFSGRMTTLSQGFIEVGNMVFKINTETDNVYFGDNFYIKDGECVEINKDYEIIVDDVILNLKEGTCMSPVMNTPALLFVLMAEFQSSKISVQKQEQKKHIFADGKLVLTLKEGKLIALHSRKALKVKNKLFNYHQNIEEVIFENLVEMGSDCLSHCFELKKILMPKLKAIGSGSICDNRKMRVLESPKLEFLPPDSLTDLWVMEEIFLPQVKKAQGYVLTNCDKLKKVELPLLEEADRICLSCAQVETVFMPKLKYLHGSSFNCLNQIKKLKLESLESAQGHFLNNNPFLKIALLPRLKKSGAHVLTDCPLLKMVYLNSLEKLEIDTFINSPNIFLLRLDYLKEVSRFFKREKLLEIPYVFAPHLKEDALEDIAKSLKHMGFLSSFVEDRIKLLKKPKFVCLEKKYPFASFYKKWVYKQDLEHVNN